MEGLHQNCLHAQDLFRVEPPPDATFGPCTRVRRAPTLRSVHQPRGLCCLPRLALSWSHCCVSSPDHHPVTRPSSLYGLGASRVKPTMQREWLRQCAAECRRRCLRCACTEDGVNRRGSKGSSEHCTITCREMPPAPTVNALPVDTLISLHLLRGGRVLPEIRMMLSGPAKMFGPVLVNDLALVAKNTALCLPPSWGEISVGLCNLYTGVVV